MMKNNEKRFTNRIYSIEKFYHTKEGIRRKVIDGGYLFSGQYPTKIKDDDLPEYYLYGRYYKRWGYMSAKGITDLMYIPNHFTNHFLKDDMLLIAYGGKISVKNPNAPFVFDKYEGMDERVYGGEIVTMLKGARKYSGYDITEFIQAIKEKNRWLKETTGDERFPVHTADSNIDNMFADDFYRPNRKSEINSYINLFLAFSKWKVENKIVFSESDIDEIIGFLKNEIQCSRLNNSQEGDYDTWYNKFAQNELRPALLDIIKSSSN